MVLTHWADESLGWLIIGSINAASVKKKCSYLSIVGGEHQGCIITGADGGGEELFFVSQPDTGPLQNNSQKNTISIWTQGSYWSHLFIKESTGHFHYNHILRTLLRLYRLLLESRERQPMDMLKKYSC